MAKYADTHCYVMLNSVDLTDHVLSAEMSPTKEELDCTAPAASTVTVAKGRIGGLHDWTLKIEFMADEATSKVAQTLWPLYNEDTQFAVIYMPVQAAAGSATTPEYKGNGRIFAFPMGGKVGELAGQTIEVKCSDGVALTREVT